MSVKGISFFEQHVEKIVLGVVALVVLGLVALTFLGKGTVVKIGNEELPPSKVDAALEERAKQMNARLDESAEATVIPPDTTGILSWLEGQLESPVSPQGSALVAVPGYKPQIDTGGIGASDIAFVVPEFDAIGKPFVEDFADSLDPEEVPTLPEDIRAELFPEGEVADYEISWTTTAATLDLTTLREQYAAADGSGEKEPVPSQWYRERVFLLQIDLEREQLIDGQWADTTTVQSIHQNVRDFYAKVNDSPNVGFADVVLDEFSKVPPTAQLEIIQPEFYNTVGSFWAEPQVKPDAPQANPKMAAIREKQNSIATLEKKITRLRSRLDDAGGPLDDDSSNGSGSGSNPRGGGSGDRPGLPGGGGGGGNPELPGGGGGGGGGGIGGDGGGILGGGGGSNSTGAGNEARRRKLTRLLNRLHDQLAGLNNQLEDLAQDAGINLQPDERQRELPNLLNDDEVLVWAHDVLAKPDHTYRYRITAHVYNPFFGKKGRLLEEQHDLADSMTMAVATSEWSEPTRVKSQTRFFVTEAKADEDTLNIGSAKIEVFKLAGGEWHSQIIEVQPGDPIGQLSNDGNGEVDFRTNAYVLDILKTPADPNDRNKKPGAKVVIALGDGTIIVRDPATDAVDVEREQLVASADS